MSPAAFALSIDFGTSSTVAILRWPDGRVKPLLFDSSPLLPSAVFATTDGALVVGRDALHHARLQPASLEPNPKRRIDDEQILLGEHEITVTALVGAVLRHVYDEAMRVSGGVRPAVALSHPAGWGPVRRLVLADAAAAAGLGEVTFVPEPVAAAHYFTGVLGHGIAAGDALIVYDFGAGTFDASVVRRTDDDFEVAAVDGLDGVGGLDLDAALVDWLRAGSPDDTAPLWARLSDPATTADARERRLLWEDVRTGKEMLSRRPSVALRVPILDRDVPLRRGDFDRIAGPLVDRTVRTTAALARHAGLDRTKIAGLFLVGGSSRIPLVASALERAVGVRPEATEQPELVVAEGSLSVLARQARLVAVSARPVSPAPAPVSPPLPVAVPAGREAVWTTLPLPRADDRPADPPPWSDDGGYVEPPPSRGIAGPVALAALLVVVLLVGVGLLTRVLKLPGAGPPASLNSPVPGTPAASASTARITDPFVPAGWHTAVTDPLTAPGTWLTHADQANTSTCQLAGQLLVTKQTSGIYRCEGPLDVFTDEAVAVDVTLRADGACGGMWLRFSRNVQTGEDAGYLLEICNGVYKLAVHGLPTSASVTPMQSFPANVRPNAPARVGVLAQGNSLVFYLDGKQVGQFTDDQFSRGRTVLGIVLDAASATDVDTRRVAFRNVLIAKPAA